jgi:putative Holliday junction resolvase
MSLESARTRLKQSTAENLRPIPRILEIIHERKIAAVVLGLPLRMDGSEGTSSAKIRKFGGELREHLGKIPLTFFDERFTTVTATEKLREAGKKAKHQKGHHRSSRCS